MKEKKKMPAGLKVALSYLVILVASFVFAISTYVFLVPARLIPGGVTGFASMLEIVTGFPAQYSILLINVPILILGLILLDKKVGIQSVFAILCISGWMQLFSFLGFEKFGNPLEMDYVVSLISALISGVLTGSGIGVILNAGGSTGGTELSGMMIQKKLKDVKVSNIILAINVVIVSINSLVYLLVKDVGMDWKDVVVILVFSLVQNMISSKTVDLVLNGFSSAVKFEIITKKSEEVTRAILKEGRYSVTAIESKGGYFEEKSTTLVCVVPKMQVSSFKRVVHESDPTAFMFSVETNEVLGKNFKKKR